LPIGILYRYFVRVKPYFDASATNWSSYRYHNVCNTNSQRVFLSIR